MQAIIGKSLVVLITAIMSLSVAAQAGLQNKDSVKNFSEYIESWLHDNRPASIDTLCTTGCVFVRFTVNQNGKIDRVECNDGTPKLLSDFLVSGFSSVPNFWNIAHIAKEQGKGKVFLLPVMYLLEDHCQPANKAMSSISTMLLYGQTSETAKPSFFGSKTGAMLDCIILPPVYFRSLIE